MAAEKAESQKRLLTQPKRSEYGMSVSTYDVLEIYNMKEMSVVFSELANLVIPS